MLTTLRKDGRKILSLLSAITMLCFCGSRKLCIHSEETAIHGMKWSQVLKFELRYFRKFTLADSTAQHMGIQRTHVCSGQGWSNSKHHPFKAHCVFTFKHISGYFLFKKNVYCCQHCCDFPPTFRCVTPYVVRAQSLRCRNLHVCTGLPNSLIWQNGYCIETAHLVFGTEVTGSCTSCSH